MKHLNNCKRIVIVGLGAMLMAGCQTGAPADKPAAADKGMTSYVRGYSAYQSGDRDAAVRGLMTAVADNPGLITARSLLADIYRQEGNYQRAAEQYEKLTALDPYDYLNFYHLGVSEHFLDQLRKAAASYERALVLKPNDIKSNMNLGLAYMALGRSDEALPRAKKAVELSPQSAEAWGNYALVLDSTGRLDEADGAYRQSLDLDPTPAGVRLNYAGNLLRRDRPNEAIALLEPLVKERPTLLGQRRLGDAYLAAGKQAEAIKAYESALQQSPKYYPAMNAVAAMKIGQYEKGLQLDEQAKQEALKMWRESLKVNTNQPEIKGLVEKWEKASLFTP